MPRFDITRAKTYDSFVTTIYCRETQLFGLRRKEREIPPGNEEWLEKFKSRIRPGGVFGRSLIIEDEDSIAIKWYGAIGDLTEIYHKEEINEARISNMPRLSDAVLGLFRTREYYWRPSLKER